jgi:hypothetical protein
MPETKGRADNVAVQVGLRRGRDAIGVRMKVGSMAHEKAPVRRVTKTSRLPPLWLHQSTEIDRQITAVESRHSLADDNLANEMGR